MLPEILGKLVKAFHLFRHNLELISSQIIHEFIHALGFFHMQSSSDRDQYVEIVWDKIQEDKKHNFEWYGYHEINHFGVAYDYGSVMHYPRVSFSTDGSETIIPIKVWLLAKFQ
jgi:hypothetical protein